jgi:toxin ParE1/3/4
VARVVPTSAARADLVEIRQFSVEQFGPEAADRYFLGFDDAFDLLATHPHAGPLKPEYGKAYRCLVHRQHRIFYVVEAEVVLIVRILHHARDARSALKVATKD